MGQNIRMEKWHNGGGVTLRIRNEYDPPMKPDNVVSLDFADVDRVLELLNDYKAHPSPYCLTATCPVHGENGDPSGESPDSPERVDFLAAVVVTAFESGETGNWAMVRGYQWIEGRNGLLSGAQAEVNAAEWESGDWRPVNLDTVREGLAKIGEDDFAIKPALRSIILRASQDNDATDIDSEGADAIIQAGVFGALVYG